MRFLLFCNAKNSHLDRVGSPEARIFSCNYVQMVGYFETFRFCRNKRTKQLTELLAGGVDAYGFFALVAYRLPFRMVATTKLAECAAADSLPFHF